MTNKLAAKGQTSLLYLCPGCYIDLPTWLSADEADADTLGPEAGIGVGFYKPDRV